MSTSKRAHASHDFELNLTPIIDCFVTLICFLLLSATYVNLVSLEAKVPIAVSASSSEAEKKPTFKLEMNVKAGGIEIVATGAGALSGRKWLPNTAGKPSFPALHEELVKIKKAYPKEFSLNFTSTTDLKYEELVRYMDVTRNLDPKDGAITFTDERNGKAVKADLLFPDFVISNLGAKQ